MRRFVHFARLKKVCKQFKQVIEHKACLTEHVIFTNSTGGTNFKSLLAWLHRNSTEVESFEGHSTRPDFQAVIGALVNPATKLSAISLFFAADSTLRLLPADAATLRLLPALKHISTCTFVVPVYHFLNLAPLQALEHLKELQLAGADEFFNLQAAEHLTALYASETSVSAAYDCKFVSCLQRLKIVAATISGLHSKGLTACTQLRSLTFKEGELHATNGPLSNPNTFSLVTYDGDLEYRIPVDMGALMALVTMDLAIDGRLAMVLDWVLHLSQLQTLRFCLLPSWQDNPNSCQHDTISPSDGAQILYSQPHI